MGRPDRSKRPDDGIAAAAPWRAAAAEALRAATYEVLPFDSTEDGVLAHVPSDVALTVTATEAKGIDATVDLAVRLSKNGYHVAPHLPARLVRDRGHLADLAAQLQDAGVDEIVAIGGDAAVPVGAFADARSLLVSLEEQGHAFSSVGVAGYPEGHGTIGHDVIERALHEKAARADVLMTQLCFDARATIRWARNVRAGGVRLPVRVGIPGAINRQKLIRVSSGLGLGQSARFLKKQSNMLWRFFLPGGYSPNRIVRAVAPHLARSDSNLSGFHVFTFNDLASTEAWRQRWLAHLP
ncbi:methylenetetrahydrofolate reductase [Salinifilum ghardaiensis]